MEAKLGESAHKQSSFQMIKAKQASHWSSWQGYLVSVVIMLKQYLNILVKDEAGFAL